MRKISTVLITLLFPLSALSMTISTNAQQTDTEYLWSNGGNGGNGGHGGNGGNGGSGGSGGHGGNGGNGGNGN
ncbi:hypothetical protein M5X66_03075 [Providencia sp. PROV188]|uniref:Uncharacterized protein n=1 Tax=Providencia alcalifaciens TaxID=126385 RepID=A0A4R3NL88_9GAMM|nr:MULTISPECIES: hypothetical protein [Providencia]MBC5789342.1 hypothetical protein [Providencia sp. JUb39]MTB44047.1 hypothetical protein [Providencia sp. wls1950]MTC24169.1 hypothetical protein [Providencia sp. wls1938]MTC43859.1 hypothetical protein [Providencia sp. wls1921]MTC44599.1 hypothetical protein [Providencia sp. wls1922]